ncbi:DUF3239 domain-containing protein [Nocardia stercoris]|uniref:DUF3239 domain-containing protein n=1 Tax=Nocardia stercoris TaxID=2483361 RepID=A0A3M2KWP4_9NOCA|nr:DUF3239 domain-containing protein [Nocardia stercoris]RMI29651.1 DUF3239 domain-containing protein [Nocardia stercoris]
MRRFEFTVDRGHARSVNEVVTWLRRLRLLAAAVTAGLAGLTALLIVHDHPWSYLLAVATLLAGITALFVTLWTPHRYRIDKLYAASELVPALIAVADPGRITLLALVNLAKLGAAPTFALVTRTVRALPGHRTKVGERVPSVALGIDRTTGDLWPRVTVMPLAWGTRDAAVIDRATADIAEVEWKLLNDNVNLAGTVQAADGQRLLLDPKQLPVQLRR